MARSGRFLGPGGVARTPGVQFWAVLVLALCLRALYLHEYISNLPFAPFPIADEAYYRDWAMRLVAGQGYGPSPYYMAPLYPHFLALIYAVCGTGSNIAVLVSQSFLGLVTLLLVYALGRTVSGHFAGVAGMVLAMLYAPLLFVESKLLSENLGIPSEMIGLWVTTVAIQRRKPSFGFLGGAVLGMAVLARPSLALFVPAAVGLAYLYSGTPRTRIIMGLTMAAGSLLVVSVVTARNYVVSGQVVPVSTNAGIVFAQGNNPLAEGIASPLPGFSLEIQQQQQEEMARASQVLGRPVTESESSWFWFTATLGWIARHTGQWLELIGKKLLWSLHVSEARDVHNIYLEKRYVPVLALLIVPFPLILGLALVGAIGTGPRFNEPAALLCAGMALSVWLVLLLFSVSFRYRLPAVPPLAVLAGVGLVRTVDFARRHAWRRLGHAFAAVIGSALPSLVPYPIPAVGAEAYNNLAAAYMKVGSIAKAEEWLDKALRSSPTFFPALYNLALLRFKQGRTKEAIQIMRRYLRLRERDGRAWVNLGVMLDSLGRKSEAIRAYRMAVKVEPGLARAHYDLAISLYEAGNVQEARRHLRRAMSLGVEADPLLVEHLLGHQGRTP